MDLIPGGATFEGMVCWQGEIRILGQLAGDARGRGRLEVGPEARIQGDVAADELVLAGVLEGDVTASRRIELQEGASVVGDIQAPVVVMADGCTLQGRLQITKPTG